MPKLQILILTLLYLYSDIVISAIYIDESIQKQISKSDVIVRGTVDSVSVGVRNLTLFGEIFNNNDGTSQIVEVDSPKSIVTTYLLNINEVLYGKPSNNHLIEIEMTGGCHDGICLEESTNYNLIEGEEYVVFLRKDIVNDRFISTSESYSVFKVHGDTKLTRLTESKIPNPLEAVKNKRPYQLRDIIQLKEEVKKFSDKTGLINEK